MNEENLISKKDLLELMDISYGQLYRWKRKKLIPEDWFIKKSSYTGQETFFPRDKVIDRIKKIKDMKDDASLDDLADLFSTKASNVKLNYSNLLQDNIISKIILDYFKDIFTMHEEITFEEVLYLYICNNFLASGNISIEECKTLFNTLKSNYSSFEGEDIKIIFIRKMGVGICILSSSKNKLFLEEAAKLIIKADAGKFIEELKLRLQK